MLNARKLGHNNRSTVGSGLVYDPFLRMRGYGGYGYLGYGYAFAPYPFDGFDDSGSLRLQVDPKNAEVYVDGYYAGVVDDFDGHFQHLNLIPGPHHVEILSPGYQPLTFDVTIEPHHKITYRGALLPSATNPQND